MLILKWIVATLETLLSIFQLDYRLCLTYIEYFMETLERTKPN